MIIFLTAGVFIISFSIYQIYSGEKEVAASLNEAQFIIESKDQINREKDMERFVNESQAGVVIGVIEIPRLNKELPIIEGTEDEQLGKGVGHFTGSKYPDQGGQIVLSGHRDTVFTNLDELEDGDEITVKMPYGTFTYNLQKTYIVDADDVTVIDPSINEETLVLSTCFPFQYIGDAPERYVIEAIKQY